MATLAAAAAQPTSYGRAIHTLHAHEGVVRAGYGDYGANTGPIHVLALDLADAGVGVVDEATLHTEEIDRYVPTSLGLLCPFTDPQGGIGTPENGSYALLNAGAWTTYAEVMNPYPVHIFGACETAEGIFAVGSSQVGDVTASYGQIWLRRADTGLWESSLQVEAVAADSKRFTACCAIDGQALAWLLDFDTGEVTLYHRTGGVWAEVGGSLFEVGLALPWSHESTPLAFCPGAGKFVGLPGDEAAAATAQAAFDTLSVTPAAACVSTGGMHLYVLGMDRKLFRHDGSVWSLVTTIGGTATLTALVVDDTGGQVLLGTDDSRILRVPIT